MTLFRPHRELLEESMAEVVEIQTMDDLEKVAVPASLCSYFGPNPKIELKHLRYDERVDWDTYLVTVNGQAVGHTNGPI
jgi:hypothetical protein